jgi:exodeoxyribonuclease V alpha subunit
MSHSAQSTFATGIAALAPGELTPAQGDLPLTPLDLAFARYLQSAQPSADPRHAWLAALVSHQFGRGHACLDLSLLSAQGVQTLGWDARLQTLLPGDLAAAASSLPWTAGGASPLVLDDPRLYLRRNWQAEQSIRTSILARLIAPCDVAATLARDLDQLFPSNAQTSDQPDWQKVACALAARKRFTLITGGPGTGKTTTVVRLLALLQAQAAQPLRIALAAPTGKAAARLAESIGSAVQQLPVAMQQHIPTQAQTLHKLLKLRSAVQASEVSALALDLVVVDEASMIDLELMARLLAAVPISAHLILLGDKDQLASVEAGAVMGQLCEGALQGNYTADTVDWLRATSGQNVGAWGGAGSTLAQQTVMLRHSHRFASSSVIGQWASAVNAGHRQAVTNLWSATPPWQADSGTSVARLEPQHAADVRLGALVQSGWRLWRDQWLGLADQPCSDAQALAMLQALGRFQVLCALREGPWGVQALNRLIGQALGVQVDAWASGRPVMVTRNDYNLNLMNGDVGLCLPTTRGLRVAFAETAPDGQLGVRWVLPSRLDAVDTVFAMTVHKSQGSEFEHVVLVLPERITPVLTRELLYTGITRAKTQLTLVVPQSGVLRQAVTQQVVRSGGLGVI